MSACKNCRFFRGVSNTGLENLQELLTAAEEELIRLENRPWWKKVWEEYPFPSLERNQRHRVSKLRKELHRNTNNGVCHLNPKSEVVKVNYFCSHFQERG